jgi:enamine deaminase RidA (YjgF/YER057c/UK114 family)
VGSYVTAVQTGNLVFTSGALPMRDGQLMLTGRCGEGEISMEAAREAARQCALNAVAVLKQHLGDLSRVRRVVKVVGFVSSHPDFYQQPAVINGASDLLVEIFGEAVGKHARSAVGVSALPMNAPVEVELTVEVA